MTKAKLVVFNMDCTLFREASNFYIARFMGVDVAAFLGKERELRERLRAAGDDSEAIRRIDLEYEKVLSFRAGLTDYDLDIIFSGISFYDNVGNVVRKLHQKGVRTAIFTRGPAPIAQRCRAKYGFQQANATDWVFDDEGKFTGEENRTEWNKGVLLRRYQRVLGITPSQTAVVEYSDVPMCNSAGIVVLFNSPEWIKTYFSEQQSVYAVSSEDLEDITKFIC